MGGRGPRELGNQSDCERTEQPRDERVSDLHPEKIGEGTGNVKGLVIENGDRLTVLITPKRHDIHALRHFERVLHILELSGEIGLRIRRTIAVVSEPLKPMIRGIPAFMADSFEVLRIRRR
jgi:hypothetical protein